MQANWKQQALVVAAVLSLGAGIGFLLRGVGHAPSNDELQRISQRMDVLETKMDAEQEATRQTLQQLDQRLGWSPAIAARIANQPAPAVPPEQRAQQMQHDAMQLERELGTRFDSLTPASANDKAPQRVNDAFVDKDVLQASQLPVSENVDCRSTMCMIRARFGPHQDGVDWTNRMLLQLSDTLPNASVTGVPMPDGGVEVHIYAARIGESAPSAGNAASSR